MTVSLPTWPRRVLFVFAWLVVGGEETEVRLLARHLNPARYRVEVVACFRKPNMPEQTHFQLAQLGVPVDRTPYTLSFEETIDYLARKMAGYDLVVACQAVREVYPALERMKPQRRPPLIEHGGLVSEALVGPKHLTARYIGVCASIRDAAASLMPERPNDAIEIPSMVDLSEFDATRRAFVRAEWQVAKDTTVVGWVGRLDRKKRVEDFIRAAALVRKAAPRTRFLVIGGPDAFMPEYAVELRTLTRDLGLDGSLDFLGDCPDVPRLLSGFDVFVWLSQDEGMPHVIGEAGAAALPVVATRDNGTEEQITDNQTGLFVPHRDVDAIATGIQRLIADPRLRQRLGENLRRKIAQEYSVAVLIPRWERLFCDVLAARDTQHLGAEKPPPQRQDP
jgi:glycosyltransferase involved in cell wall biosynthesis